MSKFFSISDQDFHIQIEMDNFLIFWIWEEIMKKNREIRETNFYPDRKSILKFNQKGNFKTDNRQSQSHITWPFNCKFLNRHFVPLKIKTLLFWLNSEIIFRPEWEKNVILWGKLGIHAKFIQNFKSNLYYNSMILRWEISVVNKFS